MYQLPPLQFSQFKAPPISTVYRCVSRELDEQTDSGYDEEAGARRLFSTYLSSASQIGEPVLDSKYGMRHCVTWTASEFFFVIAERVWG